MCRHQVLYILVCVLSISSGSLDFQIVDLTHEHGPSTVYWPGHPEYNFTTLFRGRTDIGNWYEANYISTAEHGGTHLDAPAHFSENKLRTAKIPLENLVGPGVIIDVKSKAASNADYRVTVNDLKQWETSYGRIPNKAIVVMNSGWHERYPTKTLVFNTDNPSDPSTFHFPGWHEDAVKWLIDERSVNVVAVDTPSTDYGQTTTFPVHVLLGESKICGAENVANLDKVPNAGSIIFVAVTKIHDGSGGPARIFATIPNELSSGNIISSVFVILLITFVILILLKRTAIIFLT